MTSEEGSGQGRYIIEYVAMGESVKVTAIDPVSSREVSIVGPVKAPRKQLAELAIRKLLYVLNRDKDE